MTEANLDVMKAQTFGLEVEFTGITRGRACEVIANYFNTSARHIGGAYDKYECYDNQGRTWKVVSDGSITCRLKNGSTATREYSCEFVTPICKYEDIEAIQEIIRLIRKAGACVNDSCGIHVHVGKDKHNAKTLRNLINLVYSKEDLLYKALGVLPGRQSYCKPVENRLVETVNKVKTDDINKLGNIWYDGSIPYEHYNNTRYHGLNLHNVWYAHTVEFRYFNSTLHAGKIKSYIQLCLAMSAKAITSKTVKAMKTETGDEKFLMRLFLFRLGLQGEEFATLRLHLATETKLEENRRLA